MKKDQKGPKKSLKTGHVPRQRIIDVVNVDLKTTWPWTSPSGVPNSFAPLELYWSLSDIRKMLERDSWIDFDMADKILCALNLVHLWREKLEDLYTKVNLEPGSPTREKNRKRVRNTPPEMRRCERVGCTNEFFVVGCSRHKRFCSGTCKSSAHQLRTGITKGPVRGPGRKFERLRCYRGHERTPENTRYQTGTGSLICTECNSAVQREYRERRKAS